MARSAGSGTVAVARVWVGKGPPQGAEATQGPPGAEAVGFSAGAFRCFGRAGSQQQADLHDIPHLQRCPSTDAEACLPIDRNRPSAATATSQGRV